MLDGRSQIRYRLVTMLAVIKTGGKQYVVKEGDVLTIEKLDAEKGGTVSLEVLLMSAADGSRFELGVPLLDKKVSAEVVEHGRGKKIEVVKYKAKSRYRRRVGHRQPFTKIKVGKIS